MIAFLLAIIGGVYIISRLSNEKQEMKNFKEEEQRLSEYRDWYYTKYVTSYDREDKIELYVLGCEHYDEIIETFKSDYEYVYGRDWEKKIKIPKTYEDLTKNKKLALRYSTDANWTYHMMLAKEGKTEIFNDTWPLRDSLEEIDRRYAQCVQKYLKESGNPANIVIVETGCGNEREFAIKEFLSENAQRKSASIY